MSEKQKSEAAVTLGRRGGQVKSAAKKRARAAWWTQFSAEQRSEILKARAVKRAENAATKLNTLAE